MPPSRYSKTSQLKMEETLARLRAQREEVAPSGRRRRKGAPKGRPSNALGKMDCSISTLIMSYGGQRVQGKERAEDHHRCCCGSRNHRETAQLVAGPAHERHEGAQEPGRHHQQTNKNFDHAMYHGRMAPHVHHKKGGRSRPSLLRWKPWEGFPTLGCGLTPLLTSIYLPRHADLGAHDDAWRMKLPGAGKFINEQNVRLLTRSICRLDLGAPRRSPVGQIAVPELQLKV